MATREFEDLVNQYLDNEIAPEDLSRLKVAIAESNLLRTRFNQACKLHLAERRAMTQRQQHKSNAPGMASRVSSSSSSRKKAAAPEPKTENYIPLKQLETWKPPRRRSSGSDRVSRSSMDSTPVGGSRKFYFFFPAWTLFTCAVVIVSLAAWQEKTDEASPLEDAKIVKAAQMFASTSTSSTTVAQPALAIPTTNTPMTVAPADTAPQTTDAAQPDDNEIARVSARSPFDLPPPGTDTQSQALAAQQTTQQGSNFLIPTALTDITSAHAGVPAQTSASPTMQDSIPDEATQRLEQALTALFESSAH